MRAGNRGREALERPEFSKGGGVVIDAAGELLRSADAIIGSMKKGQGLVVHSAECGAIERSRRNEPEQWIDVEWGPASSRLYQAAIKVMVANERGVLARVASR
jgi:(p)ppGpp synthase/HD superfamily hydrolase